jgi:hypothetical protein
MSADKSVSIAKRKIPILYRSQSQNSNIQTLPMQAVLAIVFVYWCLFVFGISPKESFGWNKEKIKNLDIISFKGESL